MIRRERLLDLATPRWLIEAGAGYGKSVLIEQLRTVLDGAILVLPDPSADSSKMGLLSVMSGASRRAGHHDLAAALADSQDDREVVAAIHDSRLPLVIDDLHLWDPPAVDLVVALAAAATPQSQLILSGRRLGSHFDSFRTSAVWRSLSAQDLAFTEHETAEVLAVLGADASAASLLLQSTNGWPLAVATAAIRMQQSADAAALAVELSRLDPLIDGLLRQQLDRLEGADVAAARSLALLPFFDDDLAGKVGSPGLVSRLMDGGLPVARRADGWIEIAPHAKASLVRTAADSAPFPVDAITDIIERGEVAAGLHSCLAHGEHQLAAELIGGLSYTQQALVDPAMLNGVMATLGEQADRVPAALRVQAQINATYRRIEEGSRFLARAVEIVDRTDPDLSDEASVEILLEHGLWQILLGDRDHAIEVLERCAPQLEGIERRDLLARRHDVQGLIEFTYGTVEALERSINELTNAVSLWRALGEPRPAAVTVFRLTSGAMDALGRYQQALETLESLPSVGPMTLINQARLAVGKCEVLPYVGRASEVPALAQEATRIAELIGHEWIAEWAHASELIAASIADLPDEVERLAQAYFDQGHSAADEFAQCIAWCSIADALARTESSELARAALARANELPGPDVVLELTAASVEARLGDTTQAMTMIEKLRRHPEVEIGKRWSLELLAAYCAHRDGLVDRAADLAEQSLALATKLGQRSLPQIVESRILSAIDVALPPAASVSETTALIEIAVFDGFDVSVNGRSAGKVRGHAATLLKLLVVRSGRVIVDQAIDPLWPDADLEVGRRRLRNVLGRLRDHYGEIIVRAGDELCLAPGVSSDFARAFTLADDALASDSSTAVAQAIAALDRPLLSANLYDDWAVEACQDRDRTLLKLLDVQSRLAEVKTANCRRCTSSITWSRGRGGSAGLERWRRSS